MEFNSAVYNKRRGTAMGAVQALLPLRRPLELCWSIDRYRLASRADDVHPEDDANADHGESNTANVGIANAAIRSMLFLVIHQHARHHRLSLVDADGLERGLPVPLQASRPDGNPFSLL